MLPAHKQESTGFFEPALQELDATDIYPHQSSVVNLADGVMEINIPRSANCVLIQSNTQNVRYTLSGTDPTITSGFLFTAGATPLLVPLGRNARLKVCAVANGAVLELQFGVI